METLPDTTTTPPDAPNYAAWVNVVLGLGVFVLRYASPRGTFEIHRNLFFTGLVIMFAALATAISHQGNSSRNYWSAINVITGVWLIVSREIFVPLPFVSFGQLVLGIAIAAVAIIALLSERHAQRAGTRA